MHFLLKLGLKKFCESEPVAGTGAAQDWTGSTTLPGRGLFSVWSRSRFFQLTYFTVLRKPHLLSQMTMLNR